MERVVRDALANAETSTIEKIDTKVTINVIRNANAAAGLFCFIVFFGGGFGESTCGYSTFFYGKTCKKFSENNLSSRAYAEHTPHGLILFFFHFVCSCGLWSATRDCGGSSAERPNPTSAKEIPVKTIARPKKTCEPKKAYCGTEFFFMRRAFHLIRVRNP